MKRIIALFLVGSLSGCTYTKFSGPGGVGLTRISIGTGTSIGKLQIPTTAGLAKMEGYTSEQAEVMALALEAFKAGAASALAQQRQESSDAADR